MIKTYDLNMEKCLLGALINDPNQLSLVESILPVSERTFYNTKYNNIYRTIKKLHEDGKAYDINLLYSEAVKIDDDILLSEITDIMLSSPTGMLSENYAEQVTDMYWRRNITEACHTAIDDVQKVDTVVVLSNLESTIRSYSQKKSFHAQKLSDLADISWENYASEKKNIPTGWKDLDDLVFLRKGMHVIMGARTSMGKTSFAINLATNMAKEHRPLFFTMEQSASSMADCYVSQISGISRFNYMKGTLSDYEVERVNEHAHIWKEHADNIGVYDEIMSPDEVRHKIIIEKQNNPVDVVIIDFLHSMKAPQGTNRNSHEWIREAVTQLQNIALEQNVLMITVAQLTRSMNAREDKRPVLTDIREAGEDNTDIVMFIYRDEYYFPETTDKRGVAEIIVAKNRHGKTGTVELKFIHHSTAFEDFTDYDRGEL